MVNIDPQNYFSDNYYEAKKKFIHAAASMNKESFKVIDDLTIDVATFHPAKKKNLVVIVSGTHGIEALVGSAFQLMFMDKLLNQAKDNNIGISLIHSLNPYGFANCSRVNENNVDLNRAFLDNPKLFATENEKLKRIYEELMPLHSPQRKRGRHTYESLKFYFGLVKAFSKYGKEDLFNAIPQGQYEHPEGIFYGGNSKRKEKSVQFFHDHIHKVSKGYENVVLIDVHCGLGKRGDVFYTTGNRRDSKEFKYLAGMVPSLRSDLDENQKDNYIIKGSLEAYALKHSQAKNITSGMILEFGTFSKISRLLSSLGMLNLLVAENQYHNHGGRFPKEKIKYAFSPIDKNWRIGMLNYAYNLCEDICKGLNQ